MCCSTLHGSCDTPLWPAQDWNGGSSLGLHWLLVHGLYHRCLANIFHRRCINRWIVISSMAKINAITISAITATSLCSRRRVFTIFQCSNIVHLQMVPQETVDCTGDSCDGLFHWCFLLASTHIIHDLTLRMARCHDNHISRSSSRLCLHGITQRPSSVQLNSYSESSQ